MTNKKYFALALVLGLMVFISFAGCKNRAYSVNVFSTRGGWGYDILYNNKIIIHQPYMPAVNGQVPFARQDPGKKNRLAGSEGNSPTSVTWYFRIEEIKSN